MTDTDIVDFDTAVALVLWYLRERLGWSSREMGNALGSPRTFISKIENCRATPKIGTLARYAKAANIEFVTIIQMIELVHSGSNSQ